MNNTVEVRGTELRYLLTAYLLDHGLATVGELVDALAYHGFSTRGRTSKAVSDALRWEVDRGRVLPAGRGRYRPGDMPRATAHRIYTRVRALHDRVAELSLQGGQSQSAPAPPAA
jgi:hypothetical protein